jgi:protein SCO1/2
MRIRSSSAILLLAMATVAFGVSGCHGTPKPSTAAPTSAAKGAPLQYHVRGTVVSTNPASGEVTLDAGEIPGLMPAMAMPYRLENPSELSELHPGDLITATLLADRDADGPTNFRLTEIVVIAQARPDYKPKVEYHVPAQGDAVPNFKLLDQSDRTISLQQFHGKVVLMTFIYTRCPLPDYCPRMNHNFAAIDKTLQSDPALYNQTHLLSISFDPTYDTPAILRTYGLAYINNNGKKPFQHWDFAAPSIAELPKMEQFFDVGVTPGEDGTLQHSLSTVLIGKDGKVVAFYPTNDWTTAEVLAQIHSAAA